MNIDKNKLFLKLRNLSFLRKQSVAEATILISAVTFISKFVGYLREILIAKYFGATGVTDAFLVGSIIPAMVLGLFSAGLNTLIIPTYIEKKQNIGEEKAKTFVNQIFFVWSIIFASASILTLIFAPTLIKIVAPGFRDDSRFGLAVIISRYLVFFGFLNIIVGLFTGIYQAEKQFFLPIIAGFVGNFLIVLSLIFLTPFLGIHSWTVGQTLFGVFNFSLLFYILRKRYKFFHQFNSNAIEWNEIRKFAILLFPLFISGGIGTLNTIVDRTIASNLDVGSIAALNFSNRIWTLPTSFFIGPFSTAIFPSFSSMAINMGALSEYMRNIRKAISISWYIVIPSSLFIISLAHPLTKLIYERGAFDPRATSLTSFCVQMYAIALFAYSANPIFGRVIYSFKNTLTPLLITIFVVMSNLSGNIILSRYLGAGGIALATSITMTIGFFIYYNVTYRQFKKVYKDSSQTNFKEIFFSGTNLFKEFFKILFCSMFICGIALLFYRWCNAGSSFFSLLFRLALSGIVALVAYIFLSFLFKLEGYCLISSYIQNFLKRVFNIFRKFGFSFKRK